MQAFIPLLVALLRALIPSLIGALGPGTAEEGARLTGLRDRLRDQVRKAWPAALVLLAVGLASCAPRSIYVPDGTPVRLRATIPGAQVWVVDQSGQAVGTTMDLPEGWYCLPMPAKEGERGGS